MISTEKPGTPAELVHFGTKGMKWGVRKTQGTREFHSKFTTQKHEQKRFIELALKFQLVKLKAKNQAIMMRQLHFVLHEAKSMSQQLFTLLLRLL